MFPFLHIVVSILFSYLPPVSIIVDLCVPVAGNYKGYSFLDLEKAREEELQSSKPWNQKLKRIVRLLS